MCQVTYTYTIYLRCGCTVKTNVDNVWCAWAKQTQKMCPPEPCRTMYKECIIKRHCGVRMSNMQVD